MAVSFWARAALVSLLCCAIMPAFAPFASGQSLLEGIFGRSFKVERPRRQESTTQRKRDEPSTAGWTALAAANGTGATICNTEGDLYSCFALRCGRGRGTEFAFLFNVGSYDPNARARIVIDAKADTVIAFSTVVAGREMVAAYYAAAHGTLIDALRTGKSLTFDPGFRHEFNLRGSGKAIDSALKACQQETASAPLEVVAVEPAVPESMTHVYMGFDFWGGDYDSGLTNPDLAGIGAFECQLTCELDGHCVVFTHNAANNVCILKNEIGTRKPRSSLSAWILVVRPPREVPMA